MTRTVMAMALLCLMTSTTAKAADIKKGERVFRKCAACHALEDGRNGVGPHLANLLGRPAATVEGFGYSDALANSGWVWDAETLTSFLTNPREALPGNSMSFRGLRKSEEVENLIAYLESLDAN